MARRHGLELHSGAVCRWHTVQLRSRLRRPCHVAAASSVSRKDGSRTERSFEHKWDSKSRSAKAPEPAPATSKTTINTSPDAILTTFTFPAALAGSEVTLAGSFTDWERPIPLRKTSEEGDLARSLVLPPGPIEYKYIVDGDWRHSPRDVMSVKEGSSTINNRKVVSVNTVIAWQGSGRDKEVYVAGSFLAWTELVPLSRAEGNTFNAHCCLPYGKHLVRFLVDNKWRLRYDLPTEENEHGELCNVVDVDASESFHIFSNTSWPSATLKARMVDDDGHALSEWSKTPMMRTQSCTVPWKGCAIPAPRDADNNVQPCKLEFFVLGPNKGEDRPFGGGVYELPAPGGYKLSHGTIRPFPQACQAPMMLVSDVDGTMIEDNGFACSAAADFREYWENTRALTSSVMVYNTGRSIGQVTGLLEGRKDCMVLPDAIITAVGTKVFLLNKRVPRALARADSWEEDMGWSRVLDEGWDLQVVRDAAQRHLGDRCHMIDDGSEHPHRIALSLHRDEVKRIVHRLKEDTERDGVRAQFVVSGMGEFLYLDVLAPKAGKRSAMDYVRRLYGVSKERVVVAGDSGNDVLMLEGDTPGIVVGNAQPALIAWAVQQKQQGPAATILADKALAHGILEGLARHGLY